MPPSGQEWDGPPRRRGHRGPGRHIGRRIFGFLFFLLVMSAIVGGLIIGIGEKMGEIYWGPLVGGGIESWLAYVIALVFLLFRPQGLFGEKIIERV